MNYREQAFNDKFASASRHLGVRPDQIVSLKLRDVVSSYSEYHEMLQVLEHDAGVYWTEVDGNLQGRGYLLDHESQKVIVVEHETGLEILYVASSIASLIGLIPLVLQCWGAVRGYLDRRHSHQFRSVEVRRLDAQGNLLEDRSNGLTGPSAFPLSILNTAVSSAARILDADVRALREEVRSLSERLTVIEENSIPARKKVNKRATKNRSRKPVGK